MIDNYGESAVYERDSSPDSRVEAISQVLRSRNVLRSLVRTEFSVRYKHAALGVLWLVTVPLLQSALLVVILSKARAFGVVPHFGAYVISGLMPWTYFSGSLPVASTAIVEGTALADKIWFPRALLPLVEPLAALGALAVSVAVLVVALPITGVELAPRLWLLLPACALLVSFTCLLGLAFAALHVYVRDVKNLLPASLLLWFYASPIFYPTSVLGQSRWVFDLNPVTGILALFRLATIGTGENSMRAVAITVGMTIALAIIVLEAYRRLDRTFVDRL